MARILVIAHLNHDRIWQLDAPLQSGARLGCSKRNVRLGGGGYFTGTALLQLGHDVALVSSLSSDAMGVEAHSRLAQLGFDMQHVYMRDSATNLTEILLEPSGERTIISPDHRSARRYKMADYAVVDAAYINCVEPDETVLNALQAAFLSVTQFPIAETALPRPADLIIGSRGDFPHHSDEVLWRRAQKLCGSRLRHLVMTDGTRPVTIYDGKHLRIVQPARQVKVSNAIGAGDHFCAHLISALLSDKKIAVAAAIACAATASWLAQQYS